MKINSLSGEEVLRSLVTSENGLSEEEAGRRLSEFGSNEIKKVKRTSLPVLFLRQFTHFLAILLWIGAGLALLSEYLHPGEGMFVLGLAITGVIFINALFTFIQEYRAERSLEELKKMLPFYVNVIREGKEKRIRAGEVVPGDVMVFSEGDRICADARIIKTDYLMVNNAPLTGESEPVPLNDGIWEGELIESRNMAFAGTTVVSGSGRAVVFATGMRTEFGRIAHLTGSVESGPSPLQEEIIKVTRIIAFLASVMGVFFFAVGHLIGRGFWENFIFAVGIIVANVPEGLLPTVTLSLAMGSQRMARKKALIKTLTSVEALGSITVICTDKTGTLTQNRMEVREIYVDGTMIRPEATMPVNVRDVKGAAEGRYVTSRASAISAPSLPLIMKIACLCNNAKFEEGRYKGDPTEIALLAAAGGTFRDVQSERLTEIPFDSERKRMTTLHRIEGKTLVFTKGAPEHVLPLCRYVLLNGVTVPMTDTLRNEIVHAQHSLMDRGLRVLSFSYREMEARKGTGAEMMERKRDIEEEMVFVGMTGLYDPPRPEVRDALRKCGEAGIKVIMITGDGSRTAVAIAREIGLLKGNPVVIEGNELVRMSDKDLREKLSEREVIFARMTPKHKMRVVSVLKAEGERVAVTGDGVNDAPALKKADVGIAMGVSGTDVAKEAADMILLDDNFATIVNAIEEGRAVYENIRKFMSYIFSSNVPEIVPYLVYVILRVPLPLTIMQILAVDLGTDMLPALGLGVEKPTDGIMKQPPRPARERLLNFRLLSRAYLFLGPIEAAAGLFGFFYVLTNGGWHWGEALSSDSTLYLQATTTCLTAIIITQVANVFVCRSFRESVFSLGIFSNRLILGGIAFEVLLQVFIVYHPWGNAFFSTHPIPIMSWVILLPFAVILFASEEARKYIVRVISDRRSGRFTNSFNRNKIEV